MVNKKYIDNKKILKIGITGGTGSGKTSVCKHLIDKGFQIIDSDAIARKILDKGTDAYNSVVAHFGKLILKSNGEIDRKKLGFIVFDSPKDLEFLQNIVTKKTVERVKDIMDAASPDKRIIFLDAPLLFETGLDKYVDIVLMVSASRDQRIKRLSKRDDISDAEIEKRMAAQMPEDEKKNLSDIIISNDGTLDELHLKIDKFLENFIQL